MISFGLMSLGMIFLFLSALTTSIEVTGEEKFQKFMVGVGIAGLVLFFFALILNAAGVM